MTALPGSGTEDRGSKIISGQGMGNTAGSARQSWHTCLADIEAAVLQAICLKQHHSLGAIFCGLGSIQVAAIRLPGHDGPQAISLLASAVQLTSSCPYAQYCWAAC